MIYYFCWLLFLGVDCLRRCKFVVLAMLFIGMNGCDKNENNRSLGSLFDSLPFSSQSCKGLHKVTDVDDLVQQMYANIDSTCLFDMPSSELEKVWGIKVFDRVSVNEDSRSVFNDQYINYINNENNIFIEKDEDKDGVYFVLKSSLLYQKKYNMWNMGSMSNGTLPKYLPLPDYKNFEPSISVHAMLSPSQEERANNRQDRYFMPWTRAVWINSTHSKSKPVLIIQSLGEPYAQSIIFLIPKRESSVYKKYF